MKNGMKYWRTPLDHGKVRPSHGEVHVMKDRCKGCTFCIKFCPLQVLEESEEFNRKGYHPVYAANPDACLGCGLCEIICPEFAIIVNIKEEANV